MQPTLKKGFIIGIAITLCVLVFETVLFFIPLPFFTYAIVLAILSFAILVSIAIIAFLEGRKADMLHALVIAIVTSFTIAVLTGVMTPLIENHSMHFLNAFHTFLKAHKFVNVPITFRFLNFVLSIILNIILSSVIGLLFGMIGNFTKTREQVI